MQSKCSYELIWSGDWGNNSAAVQLSKPASAFDGLRFVHYEDYSNMGAYKCSDCAGNHNDQNAYMIYLPFFEGPFYFRNYCILTAGDGSVLSGRSSQQISVPTGSAAMTQSWSAEASGVRNAHITKIYGIKYEDTDPVNSGKIYHDRTLLFSSDNYNDSARTAFDVSEPLRHFNFIEYEMNNPRASHVAPGTAKYVCPFYLLQSDTNWYIRATF